jgi:glycosyltransferase involved in cell wall biosynthesis
MAPQKDFDSVIAAARALEQASPGKWRFLLVGGGEDRERLVQESQDLVQAGVVVFRDAGLEAIDAIRAADIGVLMTAGAVWAEGCSNSIMEYMACGLPVVCSDAGGNSELVRNGREGFVVAPYSVDELAERLSEFAVSAELRRRMGEAGRSRVECEFTIERMVGAYSRLYDEALGNGDIWSR